MSRPIPELGDTAHDWVEVNGIRMHVASAGEQDAEPLLMLHGWPEHWWVWRHVIGPLSDRYRVICPDLRGFGWTDAPAGSYLKADLADDVLALADALELERFRLAGHDWGGFAGFQICLREPERVSHYVAAGISHPWVRADQAGIAERLGLLARFWYMFVIASPLTGQQVVQRVPAFMRAILTRGATRPDTFSAADLETFVSQWSEPDRARACVALYRTFLTREFGEIARGAYADRTLTQPTVLLVGEHDPVIRAESLRGAEANAPRLEVRELAGVGHWVPEEAPEAMLEALAGADH